MWNKIKNYPLEVWEDFKSVWNVYPAVLVWSGILVLIALFV